MEKKMEATIVYWGYIGIMENEMETTILGPGGQGPLIEKDHPKLLAPYKDEQLCPKGPGPK